MRSYEAALFVLTFLVAMEAQCALAACSRRFKPPPEDDCSSVDHSCLVYNDDGSGGLTVSLPEYPEFNTRTCYRTCLDEAESPPTCQASLTGVHNAALNKNPNASEYSLQRIFSPNYNNGKNYRKSTICRYNVKCDDNKLLSYHFMSHTLENRANLCGNSCIDYVSLDLINFGNEKITTCGTEAELNAIHSDGVAEINVEFVANRYEQDSGFMMFVWCSDPGFDVNAQIENFNSSKKKRAAEDNVRCERTSNAPRPTFDAVSRMSEAIEGSREAITADSTTRMVMNEGDTLKYKNKELVIKRGRFGAAVTGSSDVVSNCVTLLYVSNRIERRRVFRVSSRAIFQGYGELWISGHTAYLLQLGVKPIYVPTNEEMEVIKDLEKGLAQTLKNTDNFDVYDNLDAEEELEEGKEEAPGRNVTPELSRADLERLKASALRYGRACNGLLRSVACAYQELVLKRDCGVQKNKTTTSATVTVSVATSTTTTATANTSSSTSTTTATTSSTVTTSGTTRRKGRALTVENTQVPSTMAEIFEH